ncbi:hypothetical protein Tco_0556843 [Tanacetum coccineum]
MSKVLQERGFGSLPSSTEANPRDQVKSISTTIKADSYLIHRIGSSQYVVSTRQNRTQIYETRQMTIPFPSRLNGYYCEEKKGSYGPQFLEAYSEASQSIPQKEKDLGRLRRGGIGPELGEENRRRAMLSWMGEAVGAWEEGVGEEWRGYGLSDKDNEGSVIGRAASSTDEVCTGGSISEGDIARGIGKRLLKARGESWDAERRTGDVEDQLAELSGDGDIAGLTGVMWNVGRGEVAENTNGLATLRRGAERRREVMERRCESNGVRGGARVIGCDLVGILERASRLVHISRGYVRECCGAEIAEGAQRYGVESLVSVGIALIVVEDRARESLIMRAGLESAEHVRSCGEILTAQSRVRRYLPSYQPSSWYEGLLAADDCALVFKERALVGRGPSQAEGGGIRALRCGKDPPNSGVLRVWRSELRTCAEGPGEEGGVEDESELYSKLAFSTVLDRAVVHSESEGC